MASWIHGTKTPMSEVWSTKHGKFRVRRDPPTLAEAIIAAQGIADDVAGQIEIAASLMNVDPEKVRAEVLKARGAQTIVSRPPAPGRHGPARSVVVERRPSRRAAPRPMGL